MKRTLSVIAVSFIIFGCGDKKESLAENPIPVRVEQIKNVTDNLTVASGGSITTQNNPMRLTFLVSGRVSKVIPREGDFVRKGDLLAEIDQTDYIYNVQRAEAQTAAAAAVFEKAAKPARPEELAEARISFERAEDEYRRMKMVYDAGSLAPNDFKKYKAAYEIAEQKYTMAAFGGQLEDKERAAATLKEAEAALSTARKALNDTRLLAVSDGYVSKKYITEGDTASAGAPAFETVMLNPVDMTVGVPEKDIRLTSVGMPAEVRISALPNQIFEGTVRAVNVAADPMTRTYLTKIEIQNPDNVLKIGMAGDARIKTKEKSSLLCVPFSAVVRDPQGATAVYLYESGKAYLVRVDTGKLYDTCIQITGGLKGSEQVITAGQQRLRDGVAVKAVTE